MALGALDSPHSLPILKKALGDPDKNVKFHAITSIGNMSKENLILDWGALQEANLKLKYLTRLKL